MKKYALTLTFILLLSSCSTTRLVPEGHFRLAQNTVEIEGDKKLPTSEISSYILQQPNSYFLFGWNPFLNIYNWGSKDPNRKGFSKKIGTPPVVFDENKVPSSIDNISKHLEYLGYYGSEVTASQDTVRRLMKVHYKVKTGKRYRIDSIRFDTPPGNEEFFAVFQKDSASITVKPGNFLSQKILESESARSANVFRNAGYFDMNKNHYFFEADTVTYPGKTILDYSIRNYSRNENELLSRPLAVYRIGDVKVIHSTDIKFREKTLQDIPTVRPGDIYSENNVEKTYRRMSSLKVFNGVSVVMSPSDSAVVDCTIKLSDSKPKGIKINLEVSTNSSGLIGISPKVNWFHKNIFRGGEWLTIGFNGQYQFKFNDNVRSSETGFNVGLSLPKFLGINYRLLKRAEIPRTDFKISFNYQNRPEYVRTLASFSMGFSGTAYNGKFSYQVAPFDWKYVKLFNMSEDFRQTLLKNPYLYYSYQDHFDGGLSSVFYWTSNTDIVPKTPYRYIRFGFDISGNVLSIFNSAMPMDGNGYRLFLGVPYSQYVRAELSLGKVFRWGRKNGQALALRFNGGVAKAYGNSLSMPFEKQFYAGGANSMRGWQARALGPGGAPMNPTFSLPSQSGDIKLEFDMEYRFKIAWKFEGALFAETGNVWNFDDATEKGRMTSDFYKYLAGDWGLGLRLDLNFILIRLDAGFKVYDPSIDTGSKWLGPANWFSRDGYAIHLAIGYPF